MGSLNAIHGSRLYLDANVLIYAAEMPASPGGALAPLLLRIDSGELEAYTSELTLAEVLVKPLREGNTPLVERYTQRLTSGPTLSVVEVSRSVLTEAARLRASHPALKLPDAIHAATALQFACTTFLTNDARFEAVADLPVLLLSRLS